MRRQLQQNARDRASEQGGDDAELEAEQRERGADRQQRGKRIDAGDDREVDREAVAAPRPVSRNTTWMPNQTARFSTTPTTAAVTADSAALSASVAAQRLDVGRAEEHPEEARRERHPGHQQSAQRPGEQRRQHARRAIARQEADDTAPP